MAWLDDDVIVICVWTLERMEEFTEQLVEVLRNDIEVSISCFGQDRTAQGRLCDKCRTYLRPDVRHDAWLVGGRPSGEGFLFYRNNSRWKEIGRSRQAEDLGRYSASRRGGRRERGE
jgi:hypothetical protein